MVKTSSFENIREFIEYIIKKDNVINILNDFNTQSEKGFVYERLWDLIIKFGYCPNFSNSKYKHVISNVNTGKIKLMKNLQKYLEDNKVQSGNSGGCSDITLYNETNEKFIFISSKYPKSDDDNKILKNKPVDYYDVQKILAIINENSNIYEKYEIFLLVPLKSNVLEVVKNANKSSDYITKYMTEKNILDINDLEKCFSEFKEDLIKYEFEDYNEIFMSKKNKLMMRFHQKLINKKSSLLISEGQKQILWGCKPRSGKTFMTGGQILNLLEIKKNVNILIITPAPSETMPQFTDDLFNSFIDFNKFKIHSITSGKMLKKLEIEEETNNIFIASKQLLQEYILENKNNNIKNIDIIFFDENHFSGTTELSKNIINTYSSKKTAKIYLTATYNKPLKEWGIPENCQMFWDIEDEQICKSIYYNEKELEKLIDKHGDIVNDVIKEYISKGYTIKDIFEPYLQMPDLYLLSSLFDSFRYETIKENIKDSDYGFSFETLFSLNKIKTKFNFEEDVKTFLRYISGSKKENDFKNGDKSIFSRINKVCSEEESRLPFTQIWFLPPNNINETSNVLKKVMESDNILSLYDIYPINSKNTNINASELKESINQYETIAKKENKRGIILLAGNMLSLGITLNKCDIVMLLNNTLSSDKVMQQMYRCMTEGKNKKMGFVIDLNISRILNTCMNYSIYKKDLSLEDKIKYLIDYHLINIDTDMWCNKKLDSDILINKLLDIWKNDPINNLRTMLRNLEYEYLEFDNDTQKLLNKSFTSSIKDKLTATIELKDEDDDEQSIQSGKTKKEESSKEEGNEPNNLEKDLLEEEKKEKEISFTKDVLPFIIPLTCILTMSDTNKDFIKMLSDIHQNPELLEVFDEQSLIWWNKKDLINIIKDIVKKYINKNSNTYNISINFKMGIQSLIDKPKELLELINECLKPKEIEKKKFGEVFTPMNLVNDMLDKLPKEVWENKNFKWLDPCVGMGNFMIAVYLRLMEGLKKELPDEKKRKKHILEKMIYMCELNKKNCYIVKQIFNLNNEYKINLYEGDYLKLDNDKKFNIKNFNIIIGNPPYQEDGATGDNKLYLSFIKKSLDILIDNGLLLFITPSNIKNYITCQNKNRDYIDNLYEIKYLAINTPNKYFPNISTYFAYFLLKKNIVEEFKCNIEFIRNKNIECDEILIKKGYNLPLCLSKTDINIINKTSNLIENFNETFDIKKALYEENGKKNLQRIRKQHIDKNIVSKTQKKDYIYKIIDKINKSNPFPGVFYYYNKQMTDYGKSKIIMTTGGYLMPEYDVNGEYNLSDNMIYMLCDSKLKYDGFTFLTESNLVKYLNKITMTDNIHGRDNVIMNIKKVNLEKINNNESVYKIFKLTDEEISIIEKTLALTKDNKSTKNKYETEKPKVNKSTKNKDETEKPKVNKSTKNKDETEKPKVNKSTKNNKSK